MVPLLSQEKAKADPSAPRRPTTIKHRKLCLCCFALWRRGGLDLKEGRGECAASPPFLNCSLRDFLSTQKVGKIIHKSVFVCSCGLLLRILFIGDCGSSKAPTPTGEFKFILTPIYYHAERDKNVPLQQKTAEIGGFSVFSYFALSRSCLMSQSFFERST